MRTTETFRRLLQTSGLPDLEARILVEAAAARPRAWLLARLDEAVDERIAQIARRLYARRHAGEPIAYITGEREFYSLELEITPDVLIPRAETELLVDLAVSRMPNRCGRLLDLGTGSGALAIAIAKQVPDAEVWASDVSVGALAVARRNAARHGAAIRFMQGDWFDGMIYERFDVIVSNPPYVAADDPHLSAGDLRFEPQQALVAGEEGLDCIRRIAGAAVERLEVGGWLLFEHGHDQAMRCRDLLVSYGYAGVTSWSDLSGVARASGGRRA